MIPVNVLLALIGATRLRTALPSAFHEKAGECQVGFSFSSL